MIKRLNYKLYYNPKICLNTIAYKKNIEEQHQKLPPGIYLRCIARTSCGYWRLNFE